MAIVRLRPDDLKRAIASDSLSLQFQPQVHAPTGKLVGVEAFVRWPHPAYGMIGPSDIIPLVEQGRFHLDFDRWVVNALCEQVRKWDGEGFDVPIVAANLWAQTLRSGKAVDMLRERILAAGVSPKTIEIECPRGTLADKKLAETARRLRVLGVRTASEEFGDTFVAGAAVDFDTLKIGYPLARDLLVAGSSAGAAVAAIVAAARTVNARVVADSVESAEQEAALVAAGCDIVQGYLYGPEVSAAELRTLASAGAKRVPA
ncbi:MAG: EAL domain-containing protein [Chloroflexi bacterium]|nr:MAG: EAL domain-containing protein [Chloroflexota bacterium]